MLNEAPLVLEPLPISNMHETLLALFSILQNSACIPFCGTELTLET